MYVKKRKNFTSLPRAMTKALSKEFFLKNHENFFAEGQR
jgi:hypothetical protein